MYTNQELDAIVSTLSSLTAEELNYLKTKIDLILSQKRISEFTISNHKTVSLSQLNIVDAMVAEMKPAKKHRRPSGMWKGKVKMPDDFDELSNDILGDFGID